MIGDPRIVLTLDGGGTKLEFNAVQGGRPLFPPLRLPSLAARLDDCLGELVKGFAQVHEASGRKAVAISFAFPGPADYPAGIIGDAPNLPAFRGGVALGPMLADRFGLPVFINNDGDLFAYGEAIGGLLPWVNERSPKRYRNLIGVTLGTGFGGGIVHDGKLLRGDNSAAGEVWLLRHGESFAEEAIGARALRNAYARACGNLLEPREIEAVALGRAEGNALAARSAYRMLGEAAGEAIANVVTVIDGLVVIGGGLCAAAPLFMPALMERLNGRYPGGTARLEMKAFALDDGSDLAAFLRDSAREISVPGSGRTIRYDAEKRIGVGLSRLGTSAAISLGAYAFALRALSGEERS